MREQLGLGLTIMTVLNCFSAFSSLPGMQFPGHPDDYPTRNEVIGYLQNYVDNFQLPVMLNQRVESVEKEDEIFKVLTGSGEIFQARTIINATGSFHSPSNPIITDQEKFKGILYIRLCIGVRIIILIKE